MAETPISNTTATNKTQITADLPHMLSGYVDLTLITNPAVNDVNEVIDGPIFRCTLDSSGNVSAATHASGFFLPTYDTSGTVTLLYSAIATSSDGETVENLGEFYLAYSASAQALGSLVNGTTETSATYANVTTAQQTWLADALSGDVIFAPQTDQAYERGKLYYDTGEESLEFYNAESDIKLQIGQENWIRVYNGTGSTITNGSVVYNSGNEATEKRMTIALAQANAAATSRVLGVATHDIETATFGFVTQFGYLGGLDTSGYNDNDPIWLSDTVAGAFTATEPQSPAFSIFLGFVVDSDASAGNLFITALGNTSGASEAGDSTQLTTPARKNTTGTITKGQVVYIVGYNTGQNVVLVELADSDSAATMPALGVANATITNAATGDVVVSGRVADIDTSTFTINQSLYVSSTAGALTGTKPTGTGLIQKVANVLRVNANNGVIEVVGAGRTNDVPNFSAVSKFWAADSGAATTDEKDITDNRLTFLAGGGVNLEDNTITRPKLLDYGETVNAIGSIGGGTQDIDITLGNVVSGTVDTSETTFTFSNPSASGTACSFTLFLTNGGSQTVNWPGTVDWAGGTAPTLTAAGVDVLTFVTLDGGTIWYGFAAGLDMQ